MTPGSLLVVDDSEPNRDALSRRLRQRGYVVAVAEDGPSALALAADNSYDLILLDVEMPGMSGFEVLSDLRRTRSQTELPIIMVTARSQGADIVQAFDLGANDYLTKPVDFAVALARIGTHLSHKRAIENLRTSEERYALAVRGANDALWDWDLTSNEVHWSPRWKAMLGYNEAEIGASPDEWHTRVHQDDRDRVDEALSLHLAHGNEHYESEHRLLHRDGTYRWVHCRAAAVRNATGAVTRLAGSFTDVTDRKVADALTGLPNRFLFVDLLEKSLKRTERRPEFLFALLVLGLDRFRIINDSLGRPTADRLLVSVAHRLDSSLRATDSLTHQDHGFTLARLGSDEFTVLLDDITDASDAIRVAERLRLSLQKPFDVEGQQVFTSASIGIVVSGASYERPEELLRDGAIALHRAKSSSPGGCELFDPAMRARAVSRLQAETDLRNAIDQRAFEVHYQPVVSLTSGAVAGFEALVRWRHPTRGLVSPTEFIPLAEATGMVLPIGRMILTESCRQMAAWQRQHGREATGLISVNMSSRQLADVNLVGQIESILRETGLNPSSLKLEITETAFIGDVYAAEITLSRMRSMGVGWSLDDFGTGYSSLSYLHRLKIDTVKVDRSFVNRMGRGGKGSEMVRAIITLAHNLGMDVVAEGVETEDQRAALRALGCDYAQGFYFSEAVAAGLADSFIASQPWRHREPPILLDVSEPALVEALPLATDRVTVPGRTN